MRRSRLAIIAVIAAIVAMLALAYFLAGIRPSVQRDLNKIALSAGFVIEVFADDLGKSPVSYPGPNTGPRMMEFHNEILYASITSQGRVVALPDRNRDGKADEVVTAIEKLNKPHGLTFYQDWLYIAEENRIIRVKINGLKADLSTLQVLIDDLPTGGHFTRTIRIRNDALYISIGSSCNVCIEQDPRRAAITKCDIEGRDCKVFAKGLRNAVGIAFNPRTGELWATDNGRDLLGDDLPPEEVNLVKEGKDYGWPICFGNKINDRDFDKNVYIRDPCADTEAPLMEMQAHSAPLGLTFYYGNNFPEEYKGNMFVAFHGSWNRGQPTGYKIVRIDVNSKAVRDFASGWLQGITVSGRPVDILIDNDGIMYVSDDNGGRIYRIYHKR